MQSLGPEATLVFELQESKETSYGGEKGGDELDDSRTSMPALARPCTSGVEDDEYISPYQTRAKWLP